MPCNHPHPKSLVAAAVVAALSMTACVDDTVAEENDRVVAGELEYGAEPHEGQMTVYIRSTDGAELASAVVNFDFEIIDDTIALLGYGEADMETMSEQEVEFAYELLHSSRGFSASYLWQELEGNPQLTPELNRAIMLLSEHLMHLTEMTVRLDGETWVGDGCTKALDFNFKSCCDTHDECYCIGGSEMDRLACDKALRACIKGKGHPILAKIYYAAVRKYGKPHFNFH